MCNMIGEIWTYVAPQQNCSAFKGRPVLVIGDDSANELRIVDIQYVIISSSADKGKYDVAISKTDAITIGLDKESVIKTTKIHSGSRSMLRKKVGDLPNHLKKEFINNYRQYQEQLIFKLETIDTENTE